MFQLDQVILLCLSLPHLLPPLLSPSLQDPHGELTDQNVLIVRGSVEKTAEHFKLSVPDTEELLSQCREQLAWARQQRPKPHRDDKIVTAWNGTGEGMEREGEEEREREW